MTNEKMKEFIKQYEAIEVLTDNLFCDDDEITMKFRLLQDIIQEFVNEVDDDE